MDSGVDPVGVWPDMGFGVSPSEDQELEVEDGSGWEVEVGRDVTLEVAPCVGSSDVEGFADVDMGLGVSPSGLAVEDCIG